MRYSLPWPTALAACSSPIELGRRASAISRIPRAIAPLETITISSPSACRAAATSHSPDRTSMRGSPSPSATTLDPSLITNRLMAGAYSAAFSPPAPARLRARAGVQLEAHARDLHLVARLEALGDECLD